MSSIIGEFNSYTKSLEEFRKKRLNLNMVESISGSIIEERADYPSIDFKQILETAYLLFFITVLKNINYFWFPRLGVYFRPGNKIDILAKLISNNHFEKIKCLLILKTKTN